MIIFLNENMYHRGGVILCGIRYSQSGSSIDVGNERSKRPSIINMRPTSRFPIICRRIRTSENPPPLEKMFICPLFCTFHTRWRKKQEGHLLILTRRKHIMNSPAASSTVAQSYPYRDKADEREVVINQLQTMRVTNCNVNFFGTCRVSLTFVTFV